MTKKPSVAPAPRVVDVTFTSVETVAMLRVLAGDSSGWSTSEAMALRSVRDKLRAAISEEGGHAQAEA